jgi:hypothetical protein
LRSNFRRSGSEFIILRMHLRQKMGHICVKSADLVVEIWSNPLGNFFFQKETIFFCFTTLIQQFDPHVSNLDRTIGLAGREENVYLGPERTR